MYNIHIKKKKKKKKNDRRKETIFLLFIQIFRNNWQEATWATLLDNDLDLLLPFKRNEIRLGLG